MSKVLVAYSSHYGSTKEIAERIAQQLRSNTSWEVDLQSAEDVDGLAAYDALVVGSALYSDDWMDPAFDLLDKHQKELSGKAVWLFSSGPVGEGSAAALDASWELPARVAEAAGRLKVNGSKLFGGKIDADRLDLDDWCSQRNLRQDHSDFRNWDEIDAWSSGVAGQLASLSHSS